MATEKRGGEDPGRLFPAKAFVCNALFFVRHFCQFYMIDPDSAGAVTQDKVQVRFISCPRLFVTCAIGEFPSRPRDTAEEGVSGKLSYHTVTVIHPDIEAAAHGAFAGVQFDIFLTDKETQGVGGVGFDSPFDPVCHAAAVAFKEQRDAGGTETSCIAFGHGARVRPVTLF